ncbi:ARM repeat-containing protein [Ascobolus immersus RN42]|uniref:Nucleolar protein 9 n=1 Tax=Ascobolus immersus RN42 TaxID=1160509 RepID=A0A3N4HSU4_ASCIM|nr:ARM repeat-containing protein [Ascobolus immersus RN42]
MPKELRKRGRRAAEARKKEKEEQEMQYAELAAEQGLVVPEVDAEGDVDMEGGWEGGEWEGNAESGFYGLLDEQEQEYFRRVDEVLEAAAWGDDEEQKQLFIANTYKEISNKELKLASSQGCSRLLEKLISMSTGPQLKQLFRVFSGHFYNLVKHRFASHCVESLFAFAAKAAEEELKPGYDAREEMVGEVPYASMEMLVGFAVSELRPRLIELLTDRFASHTIRIILMVLSGQAMKDDLTRTTIKSKKKEDVNSVTKILSERRQTPPGFSTELSALLNTANEALSVADIRLLATNALGGPALSTLLRAEFSRPKKEKRKGSTLLWKLIRGTEGEDEEKEKEETATFFSNLLYDSVGSHLVETLVQKAPKKEFNYMYLTHFRPRLGGLARNETAGFAVARLFDRLPAEELEYAVAEIVPGVGNLVERGRVNVIKSLIDGCVKSNVNVERLADSIREAYDCREDDELPKLVPKILKLSEEDLTPPPYPAPEDYEPKQPRRDPAQKHASLLIQSLLTLPAPLSSLITTSLTSLPPSSLLALALNQTTSYILQTALTSPSTSTITRRKLLNNLKSSFVRMALDQSASFVVESAWDCTGYGSGLANYRAWIASELASGEREIREGGPWARGVWRRWKLDLWKSRRGDWVALGKEPPAELEGFAALHQKAMEDVPEPEKLYGGVNGNMPKPGKKEAEGPAGAGGPKKTAIQLARERHAAKKAAEARGEKWVDPRVEEARKRDKVARGAATGGNRGELGKRKRVEG